LEEQRIPESTALGEKLFESHPLERAEDLPLERSGQSTPGGADSPAAIGVALRELAVDFELDPPRATRGLRFQDRPRQLKERGLAVRDDGAGLEIRERIDLLLARLRRRPAEEGLQEWRKTAGRESRFTGGCSHSTYPPKDPLDRTLRRPEESPTLPKRYGPFESLSARITPLDAPLQ
jgi:hypothetical protein